MPELRQDLVSGDWVIIAPGREKRPHFLSEPKRIRKPSPKETCPFEDLEASGNRPIALYPAGAKSWKIAVVPNKYPALVHGGECAVPLREGIYTMKDGIGDHWLIIGRDHKKNFAALPLADAVDLFRAIQDRYRAAAEDRCVEYATGFFNWGPLAGASVWHPHYQFLAMPAVPAHIARSLRNAEAYFKKRGACARCAVIAFERREKKRVIAENARAIAVAPYASKSRYEVSVMPKRHAVAFEAASTEVLRDTAAILQEVLRSIKKRLNDPDLNFFIHSAPIDGRPYPHHHWHIEIMSRIPPPQAGFEFSTGVYITTIAPEAAARLLKT